MNKCQTRQRKNKHIQFFIVPIKMEDQTKIFVIQHSWAVILFLTDNSVLSILVLHKKLFYTHRPKINKKLFIIKGSTDPSLLKILQIEFVTNLRVWTKKLKSDKIKGQIKVKIQRWLWTPHCKKSFKIYWNSVSKEN